MKIICNLEKLREKKNISKYKIHNETGIAYSTLKKYEENKILQYDQDILIKLCTTLECTLGELLEIKEE